MSLFNTRASYRAGTINKQRYIDEMHQLHARLFEYSVFIRDTDIASIEITDRLVVMSSRATGIKVACESSDKRIAPFEILNFGFYEKTNYDMIIRLIDHGFNVFDIGANIGWYALNIAKLFDNVRVFAFEPVPATFNLLKRNVEINNLQNVYLYNFGFWNQSRKLKFYFHPENSANTSSANLSDSKSVEEIVCTVRTLDDFVNESGLSLDFIKCDVEGAELLVYKGGITSLNSYKPIIFTEMLRKWSAKFNYHPNEIIDLLANIGYRCFTVKGKKLIEFFKMDDRTVETNFFFLHSVKHASKIDSLVEVPR